MIRFIILVLDYERLGMTTVIKIDCTYKNYR